MNLCRSYRAARVGLVLFVAAALAPGLAPAQGRALTPQELEELDTLEAELAPWACESMRLQFELMVVSGMGDTALAKKVEARVAQRARPAAVEALYRRRAELLQGAQFPAAGREAYFERKAKRDAYCPWRKLEIPYELPPARDAEQAKDYALAVVPNFLVAWRLCEIYFPERRGQVEAAWAASPLAQLEWPALRRVTDEVRGWLAQGLASPAPGSSVERQLNDPTTRARQEELCDAMPANFRRIEWAIRSGWRGSPAPR